MYTKWAKKICVTCECGKGILIFAHIIYDHIGQVFRRCLRAYTII